MFADPPFNIGLGYENYSDRLTADQYQAWTEEWVAEAHRLCSETGSIYVAIGDEYAAELNIILKRARFVFRNWLVWHYGFGQNQRQKDCRCKTHIFYFTKSGNFTFN